MLAVCGLAITLLTVMLGSLFGTTQLATANHQVNTVLFVNANPPNQIGVLACPSGPSISFTPANPQPGQSVQFTGNIAGTGGEGSITMTWSFGDGASGTGQSLNHIYNFNGVYTVVMTAAGDTCSSLPTATKFITVGSGIAPASIIYLPTMLKDFPKIFATGVKTLETDSGPPTQVIGLSGTISHGASTRLTWNPAPSTNAIQGYHIYRRSQTEGSSFRLLAIMPTGTTTYLDSTSSCGQIYYVTAVNKVGESPASRSSYYSPSCRP
jgi:PKD repeat protein